MPTSKKAAKSPALNKPPKTLTVHSRPGAKLPTIIKDIEVALGKIGCRACRSGIDRIIIADPVIKAIK